MVIIVFLLEKLYVLCGEESSGKFCVRRNIKCVLW